MSAKPHHYSMLVLDIEKFGSRTNPEQELLRQRMYDHTEAALTDIGVSLKDIAGTGDRGDGAFWLISPRVSKVDLTGDLIELLQFRLRRHAHRTGEPELRLRVALHAGEAARDARNWVGADLNTACRLVDLDALRTTLAAGRRSGLALAVSDHWYTAVVRHDYPGVAARAFRQVAFRAKEVDSTAWLRVPGYERPPGIDRVRPATGVRPAPRVTVDGKGGTGAFLGAVFHEVQRVYGGDHHDYNPAAQYPGQPTEELYGDEGDAW